MRKTTNYGLSLYDTTDKMSITSSENSLNHNMELIDSALKEKATIKEMEAYIEEHKEELKGADGQDGKDGTNGIDGTNGVDGYSPIAKVETTSNGATITITDKNGTTTSTVTNGKDGINGTNGVDGKDGTNGTDGKDGVSATHSWNGTTLTITSASGTTSADLKGEKGEKGDTGEKGEQGIQGIQGEKGETGAKGDKGDKGDTGATGSKGADGYTPKKGTDYWTSEDKEEIVDEVVATTDIDVIPDYVKTEADNVIDRVIAAQGTRTFTFAVLTDLHYGNAGYTDGLIHACQGLKYIDSRIKLDMVAVLGDYTDGYPASGYANAIADFKAINDNLDLLRFAPNMRIQGNHDFYEKRSPIISRYIQSYSDDVVWGNKLGGYFYKDFADYKIRVIALNTIEEDNANIDCSTEQYEWFVNSLDLSSKEDASEWQILILSHHPLDWYTNDAGSQYWYRLPKILNGYQKGLDSATASGYGAEFTPAFDFSKGNNTAKIIGNIHGHIHNLLVAPIYINIGNTGAGNVGIYRMASPEACIDRENQYEGVWQEATSYPKTINTAKDTSFTIYCVDLDTYIINAICYGAGYDRKLDYDSGIQIVSYSITNNLTNVVNDNGASVIDAGSSYTATLTPLGASISSVIVTMGGEDVTSNVYADGVITIPEVSGNIVITAIGVEPTSYINQIPISQDTDGSVYNGKGYLENTRLNSSGATTALTGTAVTGFIPVKLFDVIRFKNIKYKVGEASVAGDYIAAYDSERNNIASSKSTGFSNVAYLFGEQTTDENGYITSFKLTDGSQDYAYLRVSCKGLDETSVITVNEPIE